MLLLLFHFVGRGFLLGRGKRRVNRNVLAKAPPPLTLDPKKTAPLWNSGVLGSMGLVYEFGQQCGMELYYKYDLWLPDQARRRMLDKILKEAQLHDADPTREPRYGGRGGVTKGGANGEVQQQEDEEEGRGEGRPADGGRDQPMRFVDLVGTTVNQVKDHALRAITGEGGQVVQKNSNNKRPGEGVFPFGFGVGSGSGSGSWGGRLFLRWPLGH